MVIQPDKNYMLMFYLFNSIGFWAVFISLYLKDVQIQTDVPFHLVRVLGGILFPLSLALAVGIYSVILHFVTEAQIDTRTLMEYLLPSINFYTGLDSDDEVPNIFFWVIVDHFFLFARHGTASQEKIVKNYVDKTFSTFIISMIIVFSFQFAVLYFFNNTVILDATVAVPPNQKYCENYLCFSDEIKRVDCSNPNSFMNLTHIHCYRFFNADPKSQSILSAFGITFGLYYAIVAIFQLISSFASILHNFYSTRLWGILFTAFGLIGVVATITSYFVPIFGTFHTTGLDTLQILIVFLYLVSIGILIWIGSVEDIVMAPSESKSILVNNALSSSTVTPTSRGLGIRYRPTLRKRHRKV